MVISLGTDPCHECGNDNIEVMGGAVFKLLYPRSQVYRCRDCDAMWFIGEDTEFYEMANTVVYGNPKGRGPGRCFKL